MSTLTAQQQADVRQAGREFGLTPEQLGLISAPRQETATAEEPTSVSPAEEPEVTDEQVIKFAQQLVNRQKPRAEIRTALLNEFSGIDNDVDDFIDRAYETEIEEARKSEDEAHKIAGEAVDEADRHLVEKHRIASTLGREIDPSDQKRAAAVIRAREQDEAEKDLREESFDDLAEEAFPECPVFPGALTELARALYPSLPLEFKQWGLIVRWGLIRSGLDRLETESHLQPRFYTVLVSQPNRGKTASIKESYSAINDVVKLAKTKASDNKTIRMFANVETLPSADSGPFLVQEFFNQAKESNKQYLDSICSEDAAKILLDPDELSDVFEKARTSVGRVSTLFIELLKLHSRE